MCDFILHPISERWGRSLQFILFYFILNSSLWNGLGVVHWSREGMAHFPSTLPPTQPLKCELLATVHGGGNSVLGSERERSAGKQRGFSASCGTWNLAFVIIQGKCNKVDYCWDIIDSVTVRYGYMVLGTEKAPVANFVAILCKA